MESQEGTEDEPGGGHVVQPSAVAPPPSVEECVSWLMDEERWREPPRQVRAFGGPVASGGCSCPPVEVEQDSRSMLGGRVWRSTYVLLQLLHEHYPDGLGGLHILEVGGGRPASWARQAGRQGLVIRRAMSSMADLTSWLCWAGGVDAAGLWNGPAGPGSCQAALLHHHQHHSSSHKAACQGGWVGGCGGQDDAITGWTLWRASGG